MTRQSALNATLCDPALHRRLLLAILAVLLTELRRRRLQFTAERPGQQLRSLEPAGRGNPRHGPSRVAEELDRMVDPHAPNLLRRRASETFAEALLQSS